MHFGWVGFGPPRVGVYRRGGGRVICDDDGLTMIADERPQGSGDERQEARGDGDGQ